MYTFANEKQVTMKKKKRVKLGRPKSTEPTRTEKVVVPVTAEEKTTIERMALDFSSVAAFVRDRVLHAA